MPRNAERAIPQSVTSEEQLMEDLEKYKDAFLSEAKEHVGSMNKCLWSWKGLRTR